MEAIVLAGGMGTRLASRLSGIPKPMAPIAGRPFLEILLAHLKLCGCTRLVLSVGHLHEVIERHFGVRFHGVEITYVVEQEPLGTGGAIRMAMQAVGEEDAVVLNGDTFAPVDYAQMLSFHRGGGYAMSMAVMAQPDIARYGGVEVHGDSLAAFIEKGRTGPGLINAGTYMISKRMAWPAGLPAKFSFETDVLPERVRQGQVGAFQSKGFFLDIGVPEDLDRAQRELLPYQL